MADVDSIDVPQHTLTLDGGSSTVAWDYLIVASGDPFDTESKFEAMFVAGLPVLVVVVALSILDVVGEGLRHGSPVLAVPSDDVGDVVAHHAAEPAQLIARVRVSLLRAVRHDMWRTGAQPAR